MDLKDRETIFAKEVVTIQDLMQLYDLCYQNACKMMRELKHESDRLGMRGKIHFEDYMQALSLKTNRYYILSGIDKIETPNQIINIKDFLQKEA